jgi:glycyl-tRNA synthetase
MESNLMEKIVSLCKRRGFIFPSSQIYGGINGFWDFGPLGVLLKNNIKDLWWREMVLKNDNIYGLDSTIIHNPKVWQASGHTTFFTDLLCECKKCHQRFRADELIKAQCPGCKGELTEFKQFNLMFSTHVGPTQDSANLVYLRPETCQGIFINFKSVVDTFHPKMSFGIAQIGKGFRNEITTGNFIFRDREFEMMELEYFVRPGEDEKEFENWKEKRLNWHLKLGIKKENLRFHEHPKESLAHYSKRTVDIEYHYPFGWSELEGIANRTDFDLKNHAKHSKQNLFYKDDEGKEFYPFVIEPSVGVERLTLAILADAYSEDSQRVCLQLKPILAPYKIAVFPLLANKPELKTKAREIYETLKKTFSVIWDDIGNIGKRYRRQDEIGTPWCVTYDFESIENNTVTVRERDSMKQIRINVDKLVDYFSKEIYE